MTGVVVGFLAGLVVGVAAGLLFRARRRYSAGVRAGRIMTANAHGHVDAEMRGQLRRWDLTNRQRPAVSPLVTRDTTSVARTL